MDRVASLRFFSYTCIMIVAWLNSNNHSNAAKSSGPRFKSSIAQRRRLRRYSEKRVFLEAFSKASAWEKEWYVMVTWRKMRWVNVFAEKSVSSSKLSLTGNRSSIDSRRYCLSSRWLSRLTRSNLAVINVRFKFRCLAVPDSSANERRQKSKE